MSGLFAGTSLERPVTCEVCERPLEECDCPRNAAGKVCRPRDQHAKVRLEKRRKGKTVTTVSGLDPDANDLARLLKRLKSSCGAGGTVSAEGMIEVQGDHREAVAKVLRDDGFKATVQ